jgi:transketolase
VEPTPAARIRSIRWLARGYQATDTVCEVQVSSARGTVRHNVGRLSSNTRPTRAVLRDPQQLSSSAPARGKLDIDCSVLAEDIRRVVIEQSKRANVGHIGSALSISDILAALYGGLLNLPNDRAQQDRMVLSKGHAALALYAALELTGHLPSGATATYCTDGTVLGVHPEHGLDGVDFCTGSLGQGLPVAVGAALAARLQVSPRRTFAVMSDAELNEGSIWEAAMFAAHHGLANLVVIVDLNGQQAMGYTKDVLDLGAPAQRWRAFGWDVHELDGHDISMMQSTIHDLDFGEGPPHVVIAHTTFGNGVSFMQNVIDWHYLPMTDEQYSQALSELAAAAA